MIFNHDVEKSLGMVARLVNTAPDSDGVEDLPDIAALAKLVSAEEVSGVGSLTAQDLAAVHRLRTHARSIFTAPDLAHMTTLVNELMSTVTMRPRLTDHDGHEWHIHYFAPGATLTEHLAADSGMAFAHVVVAGEHERLHVCEAPVCGRVLVDLSRNRSKRYCDSRTCGNRLHVAAYRERRRAAAS